MKLTNLLLFLSFCFKLAFILYTINMGFDLWDEGWYLLFYKYPHLDMVNFHGFQFIGGWLFGSSDVTVIAARIIEILIELLAIALFLMGAYRWARSKDSFFKDVPPLFLVLFSLLGAFATTITLSFSYYDFTNFCIFGASGCLLLLLQQPDLDTALCSLRDLFLLAFCGFLIGLQMFIKFSSSILFLPFFTIILIVYYHKNGGLKIAISHVIFLLGSLSALLFFVLLKGDMQHFVVNYQRAFEIHAMLGYDVKEIIIDKYLAIDVWLNLKVSLPALALLLIVGFRLAKGGKIPDLVYALLFLSAIAMLYIMHFWDNLSDGGIYDQNDVHYRYLNVYMLVIAFSGLAFLVHLKSLAPTKVKTLRNGIVLLLLLNLPVIAFAGSDTPFSDIAYEHILPWFTLMALLLGVCFQKMQLRFYFYVAVLVAILAVQFHFVHYRVHPFHLVQPLYEQKYKVTDLEPIYLDAPTHHLMDKTYQTLKSVGYKKGDAVLGISNMGSLVYFIGGYSPGTHMYVSEQLSPDLEKGIAFLCFYLNRLHFKANEPKPYVLLSENTTAQVRQCLRDVNIGFPQHYELLDTVWHPKNQTFVGIYKPK